MDELALAVPAKRVSAWVVETDPKLAQAWLASLPLADPGEAARELYQALYALNRLELDPQQRLPVMELYSAPLATTIHGLAGSLARATYPLSARQHQLVQFLCQLHTEMANGYKCCLQDLMAARFAWNRKQYYPQLVQRTLYYHGQVLLRSYHAYVATPAKLWQELHQLYRFAENGGWHQQPVEAASGDTNQRARSIEQQYVQTLLLALGRPYQLMQGECSLVDRFVARWGAQARVVALRQSADHTGHFLIDLAVDGPPVAVTGEALSGSAEARLLDASELVRVVQGFIGRLKKGEPAQSLDLGIDCLDHACYDLLKRMLRAWGLPGRRQHSRLRRRSYVSLCAGIPAIHFFVNGQQPFAPALAQAPGPAAADTAPGTEGGQGHAAPDRPLPDAGASSGSASVAKAATELFRVDRWQVRDVGPEGMLVTRPAGTGMHVRVGDVLGIQRAEQTGQWTVGAVRWLKNLDGGGLEMGVEFLAPDIRPAAVRSAGAPGGHPYNQALLLPAVRVLKRPATLLVPRGTYRDKDDLDLVDGEGGSRRVRPMHLVERSGSFEQIVFGDVMGRVSD